MFVGSNLAEGIQSPQQSARPEEYYETMIRNVVGAACKRRGGLSLHVSRRGHQPVSEKVTFKAGDLTEVQVRQDFSFVLVFRRQRFWVQSKAGNCAAIQCIQAYVDGPEEFEFPESVSFSTGG